MAFLSKQVLLIGATSGIGHAMANRLIREGSKVIAVGRRQDRLNEFVKEHGSDKASAVPFDLAKSSEIPRFVKSVFETHPDIDCVFLNAGIQQVHDLSKPESFNFDAFNEEINVNFTSFVALTMAVLPHLLKRPSANIIFTGSNLAIVPGVTLPGYSASKAALNAFVLCLRAQISKTAVKVIEISPPPVQTELHDYVGKDRGRSIGMPLDQFTGQAYEGLASGKDQIVIGAIGPDFNEIVDKRRSAFDFLTKMITDAQ